MIKRVEEHNVAHYWFYEAKQAYHQPVTTHTLLPALSLHQKQFDQSLLFLSHA